MKYQEISSCKVTEQIERAVPEEIDTIYRDEVIQMMREANINPLRDILHKAASLALTELPWEREGPYQDRSEQAVRHLGQELLTCLSEMADQIEILREIPTCQRTMVAVSGHPDAYDVNLVTITIAVAIELMIANGRERGYYSGLQIPDRLEPPGGYTSFEQRASSTDVSVYPRAA